MEHLDKLFKFPVILVDGAQENNKSDLNEVIGMKGETYPEYLIGEAEVPYDDFSHVIDMWKPKESSYIRAKEDKVFNACLVSFQNCGTYMVPQNKAKFLESLRVFSDQFEETQEEILDELEQELLERIKQNHPELDIELQLNKD